MQREKERARETKRGRTRMDIRQIMTRTVYFRITKNIWFNLISRKFQTKIMTTVLEEAPENLTVLFFIFFVRKFQKKF